mmetsp:Transcript_10128/g.18617  ORF Transcript_10128/g.18617 Transcript_10128/m.18617 type:complete len:464 (+) Transcript_10128:223-1614(+)
MGAIVSGMMGATSLACQSAMCCCSMTNCMMTAGNGMNGVSARSAKIYYILVLGVSTLIALLLRFKGEELNIDFGPWNVHCSDAHDVDISDSGLLAQMPAFGAPSRNVYCKGDAAVFRISFVLTIFFSVMTVFSLTGRAFHRGYWGLKLVGLFFGLLLCFFIPNSFFDNSGYAWLARIGSIMFLLMQILILIDFSYQLNESMVDRAFPADGGEDRSWLFIILGLSAVLFLVTLVGIPLLFTFYGDCGLGVGFSTITLVGVIVLTAITLFRDKIVGEDYQGAILPAGVVSAYATFLCWSALESNPDTLCKPDTSMVSSNVQMGIGIAVAVISLCWTSFSVTDGIETLVTGDDGTSRTGASTPLYTVEGSDGGSQVVEQESFEAAVDDDEDSNYTWLFHFTMVLASMYLAMIATNWGAESGAHGNDNGQIGLASAWVKILSQWMVVLLYIWTLVAPRVLAGREFDF